MTRDTITGFMLGISFGFVVGYLQKLSQAGGARAAARDKDDNESARYPAPERFVR